jgi:hypothetical protein
MRKLLLSMLVFGITLAGCGSDEPFGVEDNPVITQISVSSSVASIPTDGSSAATITAFARDASNNLIANVPITFTATSGGLAAPTASTNANGEATVTLNTAGDSSQRTIIVTATSGTLQASVNVAVTQQGSNTPLTVSMGSGTGATFVPGTLAISSATLAAGGSTTVQAVLQQSDGTLYTGSATVNFNSGCAAQGLATITPSPTTTTAGIVTVNYVATGCSGADVISATSTVNGSALSASGTVTVAPSAIGSVIFVSATPSNIALQGTGTAAHPETSTVIFRVRDQSGGNRAGATVNFSLNTNVGGISISPASAVSGADGTVQTVVQGGTVATSVRVTATVQGIAPAQSNQLTITTGIPDQNSFSLAVECPNVEGWSRDGEQVEVTARLADRFNNPVPQGTAVTFQTEGGSITSQCTTVGETGACAVNWTSANPRPSAPPSGPLPRAGRATILATAIGEESFTDLNGNGSFDNGENFTDLPERFLDENENGTRDAVEPIYDFNNNSNYDPLDGMFNGVLCLDTSGRCGSQNTTGIAADNVIIMSGSTADNVDPANGTMLDLVNPGGSASYTFTFEDVNENPMAAGTTIDFQVSGTGLSVASGDGEVPCSTEPIPRLVTINATGAATTGTLTVIVTSPASGLPTILTYPIF